MSESRDCLSCMKAILPDTPHLTCAECDHPYHTGKCSGVTKTNLKGMTPDAAKSWLCLTCAHAQSQLPLKQGATAAQVHEPLLEPGLAQVLGKLDAVLRRLDELEKRQELQLAKHDTTDRKIEKQGETILAMESSLDVLSTKYDEILESFEIQKQEIKTLKKKINELEAQSSAEDSRLLYLETELEKMELYSRRNNLEMHGIQTSEGENLRAVIGAIAGKLGLPTLRDDQIEAIHRVGGKRNAAPPILVRFVRRETKEQWMVKRNCLKGDKIYLNDNLTAKMKKLLWQTKTRARERQYRFVWVKQERIFVRKEEGSPAFRIDNLEALNKIT